MKSIQLETVVERDGEIHLEHLPVQKGQRVRATLEIEPTLSTPKSKATDLIGLLKGTWGSAEAIDRYLKEERDSWE